MGAWAVSDSFACLWDWVALSSLGVMVCAWSYCSLLCSVWLVFLGDLFLRGGKEGGGSWGAEWEEEMGGDEVWRGESLGGGVRRNCRQCNISTTTANNNKAGSSFNPVTFKEAF